jgi:ubiquinone/menaquinone biosynthesis C-methylase UbiE
MDRRKEPTPGAPEYVGARSAVGWDRGAAMLQKCLGPATERMLDLCGIGRGSRVLDIAAGTGLQTLQIAERVGPGGFVLATDISGEMLEVAASKAASAGYANVTTKVMDGQALEVDGGSFDAVVCRLGLMFFPNPDQALAGFSAALRADGRMVAMVFTTAERNPQLSVPAAVANRRLARAVPTPAPLAHFSLGTEGVLERKMKTAGFVDVAAEVIASYFQTRSAREYVDFLRHTGGGVSAMVAREDEATQAAVWREIEDALRQFGTGSTCIIPVEVLVAGGAKAR